MDFIRGFTTLPPYGQAALIMLLLYAVETEVRFGKKARTIFAGRADRGSTLVVSISQVVPVFGFVLAIRSHLPHWMPALPGLPAIAWAGVVVAAAGILLRLWAVLVLRERYTRTLLVHEDHAIERGGPYRFVRHPGYLGSLLTLNGLAVASGNAVVLIVSLVATLAAYAYRISVEDGMLVSRLGISYETYRRDVSALIPFVF